MLAPVWTALWFPVRHEKQQWAGVKQPGAPAAHSRDTGMHLLRKISGNTESQCGGCRCRPLLAGGVINNNNFIDLVYLMTQTWSVCSHPQSQTNGWDVTAAFLMTTDQKEECHSGGTRLERCDSQQQQPECVTCSASHITLFSHILLIICI